MTTHSDSSLLGTLHALNNRYLHSCWLRSYQRNIGWMKSINKVASLRNQRNTNAVLLKFNLSDAKAIVESQQLDLFLAKYPDCLVVDVREGYEQSAGQLGPYIPATTKVVHVPLSRICWSLMKQELYASQRLLLVCRSGNRSLLAAKILNRAGFAEVYNLKGGIALLC